VRALLVVLLVVVGCASGPGPGVRDPVAWQRGTDRVQGGVGLLVASPLALVVAGIALQRGAVNAPVVGVAVGVELVAVVSGVWAILAGARERRAASSP
jgi:hypothetical protein